jgi:hypothetical protein
MNRIDKNEIIKSTYELNQSINNKLFGLLTLFVSTNNIEEIQTNTTYRVDISDLSNQLQDLFYFGKDLREYNNNEFWYYRLSKQWETTVKELINDKKPNILDFSIFYFKNKRFEQSPNSKSLVKDIIDKFNISKSAIEIIFDLHYEDRNIELSEVDFSNDDLLTTYKQKHNLTSDYETISFDSHFLVKSHPSELSRGPYIQTLYSGMAIQELVLLTKFDLDKYYPKSQRNISITNGLAKNIIFYGAPGTGKSHKINQIISDKLERTERVTFHPEYDYSSFVGGYKPTMLDNNIRYEFVPQAFTKIYVDAWNDLENDYYLVIEEINRGNCAEIFGDIFQLLDRENNYDITPSKELKDYLIKEFSENSNTNGSKLILPPNLNILATMNTSDQSLFPMDSAFKRRWDWEYIPINYEFSDENNSSKFIVQISQNEGFSWLSFIKSVNDVIKENDNLGMDKCLGNYFLKPENGIIEIDTFINKAVFYLWNDVFKDEIEEHNIFKERTTYEDFFPIKPNGVEKIKKLLELLEVDISTIASEK